MAEDGAERREAGGGVNKRTHTHTHTHTSRAVLRSAKKPAVPARYGFGLPLPSKIMEIQNPASMGL